MSLEPYFDAGQEEAVSNILNEASLLTSTRKQAPSLPVRPRMDRNIFDGLPRSTDLKDLSKLRSEKSPAFSAHRQFQLKKAAAPGKEDQEEWFNSMKVVFEEIDHYASYSLVPFDKPSTFLDIGCCPGGFSSYILSRYPKAYGVGISLPVSDGGHEAMLEEDLQHRFHLIWADITKFRLGPAPRNCKEARSFIPFALLEGPTAFDLILVDGHPLRHSSSSDVHHFWNGDKILISQLLIALRSAYTNLKVKGKASTIVIKLSKPDKTISAQIMYMLDVLSSYVGAMKPLHMHATRSTFYFMASGVGQGSQGDLIEYYIRGLTALWSAVTFGERGKRGRRLKGDDLDFIMSEEDLQFNYADRLNQLAGGVWYVEKASLQGWYGLENFKL